MQKSILVINSGSSSIKCSLLDRETHKLIMSAFAEELGGSEARITYKQDGEKTREELGDLSSSDVNGHEVAIAKILDEIEKRGLKKSIVAVGHRVVHGGEKFQASTVIDDEVLASIEAATPFAPLHNPANIMGIKSITKTMPHLPQVAVFDTAFHQTLPDYAYRYAVPSEWYEQYGVRRYGFHGTSHRYVSEQAAKMLDIPYKDSAIIVAHLGNGASLAAVLNGQSVDTTMGFTPLEGLSMGTRSGDVDPAVVTYMADKLDVTAHQIIDVLNKKSGHLGVSTLSSDQRDLEQAAQDGDKKAQLSLDIYAFRVAKYIGALMTSLPRVDGIVFTAGTGENGAFMRKKIVERLAVFGYKLDDAKNDEAIRGNQGVISADGTPKVLVVSTDEELMIALDTSALTD